LPPTSGHSNASIGDELKELEIEIAPEQFGSKDSKFIPPVSLLEIHQFRLESFRMNSDELELE